MYCWRLLLCAMLVASALAKTSFEKKTKSAESGGSGEEEGSAAEGSAEPQEEEFPCGDVDPCLFCSSPRVQRDCGITCDTCDAEPPRSKGAPNKYDKKTPAELAAEEALIAAALKAEIPVERPNLPTYVYEKQTFDPAPIQWGPFYWSPEGKQILKNLLDAQAAEQAAAAAAAQAANAPAPAPEGEAEEEDDGGEEDAWYAPEGVGLIPTPAAPEVPDNDPSQVAEQPSWKVGQPAPPPAAGGEDPADGGEDGGEPAAPPPAESGGDAAPAPAPAPAPSGGGGTPSEQLMDCCTGNSKIDKACYKLCNFENLSDKDLLISAFLERWCPESSGGHVFDCASQKQDHTDCCVAQGVQDMCVPFCNPSNGIVDAGPAQAACLNDIAKIIGCMRDAY